MDRCQFDAFSTLKALRKIKLEHEQKKKNSKLEEIIKVKQNEAQIQKKPQSSQQELRSQFLSLLSRVNDQNVREQVLKECKIFIQENYSINKSLNILIQCIIVPQIYKENDGTLKIINQLIDIYGDNILMQDLYKLLEVVMKHLKIPQVSVINSCSVVWKNSYNNFASKLNLQQRSLIFFQTLAGMIAGGSNLYEQCSAMIIIQNLFEAAVIHKDLALIKDSSKTFLNLFFRQKLNHPSLFYSLEFIITSLSIQQFSNQQILIIDKCLNTFADVSINYKIRNAAGSLLKTIGIQYQGDQISILGSYHNQVIQVIQYQIKDRLVPVQNQARIVLKEWSKVKLQVEASNMEKQIKNINTDQIDLEEFLKHKQFNQNSKNNQQQLDKQNLQQNPVKKSSDFQQQRKFTTENKNTKQIKNIIYNSNYFVEEQDNLEDTQLFNNENLEKTIDYSEQQINDDIDLEANQYIQNKSQNLWDAALELIQSNKISEALKLLLEEGNFISQINIRAYLEDDLYLLRVLLLQKDLANFLEQIDVVIRNQLFRRVGDIMGSQFLSSICLDFVSDFVSNGVGDMFILDNDEDDFLDYLLNQGEQQDLIGRQSVHIYNQIKNL